MKLPATSKNDLQAATRKNDLIVETGFQIQKDFAEFGLEIKFSGNADFFYDELFVQMKSSIGSIMAESMERFMNFLYRIDISQQNIAQYENEMQDADIYEVLTELVIHREIKKVITRDFFRQQTNNNDKKEIE